MVRSGEGSLMAHGQEVQYVGAVKLPHMCDVGRSCETAVAKALVGTRKAGGPLISEGSEAGRPCMGRMHVCKPDALPQFHASRPGSPFPCNSSGCLQACTQQGRMAAQYHQHVRAGGSRGCLKWGRMMFPPSPPHPKCHCPSTRQLYHILSQYPASP